MRYFINDASNRKVALDIDPNNQLGKGATAVIYKVDFESELVAAKVYHSNKKVDESKIRAMLSNKPDDIHISFAGVTYPQIAWPFAMLEDEHGKTAGYLMPLVDLHDSFSLDYFYDQVLFKKLNAPDEVALSYKLEIAKNLSLVVASLHKNKHYFIDLKPQNIRVFRQTHIVSLVDCDGFSVADKKSNQGSRYPAELISTDYISPEAFRGKISPKDLGENQDRYALAVILFQLLNNGTHPFQGILKEDDGIATNDEKAAAGLYPHALQPSLSIKPRPQSIHFLWDDKTRELFDRAFTGKLDQRPSAEEWASHFEKLLKEKSLIRCDKEPLNMAHMRFKGKDCPTCYLENIKTFKPTQRKSSLTSSVNDQVKNKSKTLSSLELFVIILAFIISIMIVLFSNLPRTTSSEVSYNSENGLSSKEKDYGLNTIYAAWSHMDPSLSSHDYSKAYELNLKGYQQGQLEGASNIGLLYENGWGVEKNLDKALEWYTLAADKNDNNHSAQAELGIARILFKQKKDKATIIYWINATRRQSKSSLPNWRNEEYQNQADELEKQLNIPLQKPKLVAQNEIKSSNITNLQKPNLNEKQTIDEAKTAVRENDFKKAIKILIPLSNQGDSDAQVLLANLYSNGYGVAKNPNEEFRLNKLAAEKGNSKAQFNMGQLYSEGRGVPQDHSEAVKWYRKAAEQDLYYAQLYLATKYVKGEGVAKNYNEAFKWFKLAADKGNSQAQHNVGVFYEEGLGDVDENFNNAAIWFKKAAAQGYGDSQYSLGMLYWSGKGLLQNDIRAYQWLTLSLESGSRLSSSAQKARDTLAGKMSSLQIEEAIESVQHCKKTKLVECE